MAKKLGAPIALGVITILVIVLITGNGGDNEVLKSTFSLNAVYYPSQNQNLDDGYIQITFKDNTNKTKAIVLEVLGMETSFQKTFLDSSEFVEKIPFSTPPKYGWEIHPVTLQIDHEDLGKVSLKTEIRPVGEPAAPIIYGKP